MTYAGTIALSVVTRQSLSYIHEDFVSLFQQKCNPKKRDNCCAGTPASDPNALLELGRQWTARTGKPNASELKGTTNTRHRSHFYTSRMRLFPPPIKPK